MNETEQFTPSTDMGGHELGGLGDTQPPEGLEGAPSPEELAARALDHEGDEKAVAELLIPSGSYNTVPAVRVREFKSKEQTGGTRLLYFATANIVNARDINQKIGDQVKTYPAGSIEDSVDFRYSHQRRNKDTGEPDSAYQRYLELKAVYKQANNGEAAKSIDDLNRFIENYPVNLRITQYSGKNWVVNISAVRV